MSPEFLRRLPRGWRIFEALLTQAAKVQPLPEPLPVLYSTLNFGGPLQQVRLRKVSPELLREMRMVSPELAELR